MSKEPDLEHVGKIEEILERKKKPEEEQEDRRLEENAKTGN